MKQTLKHFIGADVHQSTTTLCVLNAQGERTDLRTLATSELALRSYLKGIGSPKGLVMEEGSLAQWLFLVLRDEVDDLVICDPYQNHLLKKGAKNDAIDARKLAELYRAQMVSPVFHTDDQRMEVRKFATAYRETVQAMVRTKLQHQAVLRRVGNQEENLSVLEKKVLGLHEERLEVYLGQKDQLEKELKYFSKRYPEVQLLQSIPGIGPIGAMKLLATVVDPKRFATKHKFWSYCGLVRALRESGGQFYGSNRGRGNVEMKNVFKTAALACLQGQGPLKVYYESLREKGLAEHDARHAVARKIAAIVLACWKGKKRFDAKYLRPKKEELKAMN